MSRDDRENRLEMITGVYFSRGSQARAQERLNIHPFQPEKWEEKVIDLEGRYYWGRKYENYQVVFDKVVFPFNLNLHNDRSGLLAYVETALPVQYGYREENERFQRLYPGKIEADDRIHHDLDQLKVDYG